MFSSSSASALDGIATEVVVVGAVLRLEELGRLKLNPVDGVTVLAGFDEVVLAKLNPAEVEEPAPTLAFAPEDSKPLPKPELGEAVVSAVFAAPKLKPVEVAVDVDVEPAGIERPKLKEVEDKLDFSSPDFAEAKLNPDVEDFVDSVVFVEPKLNPEDASTGLETLKPDVDFVEALNDSSEVFVVPKLNPDEEVVSAGFNMPKLNPEVETSVSLVPPALSEVVVLVAFDEPKSNPDKDSFSESEVVCIVAFRPI